MAVTALLTTLSRLLFIDVDWDRDEMLFHFLDASDPPAIRASLARLYDRYQRHVFRERGLMHPLMMVIATVWLAGLLATILVLAIVTRSMLTRILVLDVLTLLLIALAHPGRRAGGVRDRARRGAGPRAAVVRRDPRGSPLYRRGGLFG